MFIRLLNKVILTFVVLFKLFPIFKILIIKSPSHLIFVCLLKSLLLVSFVLDVYFTIFICLGFKIPKENENSKVHKFCVYSDVKNVVLFTILYIWNMLNNVEFEICGYFLMVWNIIFTFLIRRHSYLKPLVDLMFTVVSSTIFFFFFFHVIFLHVVL